MLITFHNVQDGRDHLHGSKVTFLESEKVRGDLVIDFGGNGADTYRCRDVSIPLAVAEIKLFLTRVRRHGSATWRLCFAPFLDGKLENDSVRLMEGSRDHLSGRTIEILSPEHLKQIEADLDELERRYGRLVHTDEAAQSQGFGDG